MASPFPVAASLTLYRLRSRRQHRPAMFFFLMIRRPPRSTLDRSSAASDVYKRQALSLHGQDTLKTLQHSDFLHWNTLQDIQLAADGAVSYTHLRAHETVLDLVCRLLLEKKKTLTTDNQYD